MKNLKYIFIGILVASTSLFGYYDQNTINDPFQQLNRNIQYNNMNQQSMSRTTTKNNLNFDTGNIQQPTYQQPVYNYSNSGGGGGGRATFMEAIGWPFLGVMALLLIL